MLTNQAVPIPGAQADSSVVPRLTCWGRYSREQASVRVHFTEDLLDDEGLVDDTAVQAAVEDLIKRKPYLVAPRPTGDVGRGGATRSAGRGARCAAASRRLIDRCWRAASAATLPATSEEATMSAVGTSRPVGAGRLPVAALACGVLALVAVIIAFWMIVPAVVLGLAAILLGVRGRKRAGTDPGGRELASAGIALGVASILLVPAMYMVSEGGEAFGRHCAVEPTNPHC